MATKKAPVVEKLVILDPETGELQDLPKGVLRNRGDLQSALIEEAHSKKKWTKRATDYTMERMSDNIGWLLLSAAFLAVGAVLGMFGAPIYERQTQAAQLYKAMATSIPVVNAMEVAMDPGKFVGKLTDVVMTPTSGAVFKSRKGMFLSENNLGLSLVIFESAFEVFQTAYDVETADDIAPYLIGKTIKARGIVQNRIQADGSTRTSMIISAPGLIQIIPERP